MKKKRMRQLMVIGAAIFILVFIVAGAIILLKSVKKLKSITLTPNFAETELDVNQDYVFQLREVPPRPSSNLLNIMLMMQPQLSRKVMKEPQFSIREPKAL